MAAQSRGYWVEHPHSLWSEVRRVQERGGVIVTLRPTRTATTRRRSRSTRLSCPPGTAHRSDRGTCVAEMTCGHGCTTVIDFSAMEEPVMSKRATALVVTSAVILSACGASATAPQEPVKSTTSSVGLGGLTSKSGSELFVTSGWFTVRRAGTYTVIALGGGGGGGGGGSALTVGGVLKQAGGAGGASGAVTINAFVGHVGERLKVTVGAGGKGGAGGTVNGGSGERGVAGGASSCAEVASADGGSGGAGSPGNSDAVVLNPVGAGNSSDGTDRTPGSGGGSGPSGGGISGSAYLQAWPGGGGGGTASANRGGGGGGAAGTAGTDSAGGGIGTMTGPAGGDGATNHIYTSAAGGGGGGGGAPNGAGGAGGAGVSGFVAITFGESLSG